MVEDPTQLSKHGKPRIAPIIYPLVENNQSTSYTTVSGPYTAPASPVPSSIPLRQTSGRDADAGNGVFITLSTPSRDTSKVAKKTTVRQRRKVQLHLNQLQEATALSIPHQLVTSQTALAARYLNLLGSRPSEEQPFSILGSWVESIPSRIGKSPAVDLAVEYLVHSFDVYHEQSFSSQRTAWGDVPYTLRL